MELKWKQMENGPLIIGQPCINFKYPAFDDLLEAQDSVKAGLRTLELLTSEKGPYTFVGRGSSGLFLSTLGAVQRPGSDIVWFRKKEDISAHIGTTGYDKLSGQKPTILFDDIVCSGETVAKVKEEMVQSKLIGTSDYDEVDYMICCSNFWVGKTWKDVCSTVKPKIIICYSIEA